MYDAYLSALDAAENSRVLQAGGCIAQYWRGNRIVMVTRTRDENVCRAWLERDSVPVAFVEIASTELIDLRYEDERSFPVLWEEPYDDGKPEWRGEVKFAEYVGRDGKADPLYWWYKVPFSLNRNVDWDAVDRDSVDRYKWEGTVNWGAYGSMDPSMTRKFAWAVEKAADLASILTYNARQRIDE